MSTLSKVLLFFLLPTSMALAYLSMRTLKTWEAWRTPYVQYEKAIYQRDQQIAQLRREVNQLKEDLEKVFALRGKVWIDCQRKRVDPNTQQVGLRVEVPNPPGLKANQIVYLFQYDGPHYLGEFKVVATGAADANAPDAANVVLQPTRRLPNWVWNNLVRGTPNLEIRDSLPTDFEEAFAECDEQRLRQLFPLPNDPGLRPYFEASLNQYLRDGKELGDDQDVPPDQVRVWVRFLKDASELTPQEAQLLQNLFKVNEARHLEALVVKNRVTWFWPDVAQPLLQATEVVELVKRTYRRPLRDYATLFDDLERALPVWNDRVQRAAKFLSYLQEAVQSAQQQVNHREQYLETRLKPENQRLTHELQVVSAVLESLQEQLQIYRQLVDKLLQENQQLAQRYREAQLSLAREIDRRAKAAAAAAVP